MLGGAAPLKKRPELTVHKEVMTVAEGRSGNPRRWEHIDASDLAQVPPSEITRRLEEALRRPDYTPPLLPAAALEIAELTRNPDVDLRQVRRLLESEPLLLGKVMQLAQSAHYSRSGGLRSLDDALARLGTRTLSDLFLQVAVSTRVFRARGYEEPMNAIRRHSIACAHLARRICHKSRLPEEYAFLCGLLHDCGMAVSLIVLADVPRGQTPPPYADVQPSVDAVHALASGILAKAWQLPKDIQVVLRNHHDFKAGGPLQPMIAAVCVADAMAAQAGFTAGAEHESDLGVRAARLLDLSPAVLSELERQGREVVARYP
jgi:HD-like signal output (HDOD) protein